MHYFLFSIIIYVTNHRGDLRGKKLKKVTYNSRLLYYDLRILIYHTVINI